MEDKKKKAARKPKSQLEDPQVTLRNTMGKLLTLDPATLTKMHKQSLKQSLKDSGNAQRNASEEEATRNSPKDAESSSQEPQLHIWVYAVIFGIILLNGLIALFAESVMQKAELMQKWVKGYTLPVTIGWLLWNFVIPPAIAWWQTTSPLALFNPSSLINTTVDVWGTLTPLGYFLGVVYGLSMIVTTLYLLQQWVLPFIECALWLSAMILNMYPQWIFSKIASDKNSKSCKPNKTETDKKADAFTLLKLVNDKDYKDNTSQVIRFLDKKWNDNLDEGVVSLARIQSAMNKASKEIELLKSDKGKQLQKQDPEKFRRLSYQAHNHAIQGAEDKCPSKAQVHLGVYQMLASCNGNYDRINFLKLNNTTKTHLFMAMRCFGVHKADKDSFVAKLKEKQTQINGLVKSWNDRNKQSTPTNVKKVKKVTLAKLIFHIALGAIAGFALINLMDYYITNPLLQPGNQDKFTSTQSFTTKFLRWPRTTMPGQQKTPEPGFLSQHVMLRFQWMMSAFMGWICGCKYLRRK